MVKSAIYLDQRSKGHLKDEMQSVTGHETSNPFNRCRNGSRRMVELDSLGKKELQAQLSDIEEPMRSVLLLRQQLAMSAVKKYQAMETAACTDGRCVECSSFMERIDQEDGRENRSIAENLFRNSLPDLEEARDLVKSGNYDALALLYDSVPEVLAQCVRTAFYSVSRLYKFIVSAALPLRLALLHGWLESSGAWKHSLMEKTSIVHQPHKCFMFQWRSTESMDTSVRRGRSLSWHLATEDLLEL